MHPYDKFRQEEHGKQRAKQFTGKAGGGEVPFYETKSGSKGSIESKGVSTYRRELGREGGRFGGKQGIWRLLEDEVSGSDKPVYARGGTVSGYAKGGKTKGKKPSVVVNVISGEKKEPPMPPPGLLGALAGAGKPPMPPPGAGGPPMPPPGAMKRGGAVKRLAGGRVKMTGGSGGGLGRIQESKAAKIMRGKK